MRPCFCSCCHYSVNFKQCKTSWWVSLNKWKCAGVGRRWWCSCDSAWRLFGSVLDSRPPWYQIRVSELCDGAETTVARQCWVHDGLRSWVSASVTEKHFLLWVCEELGIHLSDLFLFSSSLNLFSVIAEELPQLTTAHTVSFLFVLQCEVDGLSSACSGGSFWDSVDESVLESWIWEIESGNRNLKK